MSLVEQLLLTEKDYYRLDEVAHAFGVTKRSVQGWVRNGHIPAIKTPAGHYKIPRASMMAASPSYLSPL